jgi:hypothetical protein
MEISDDFLTCIIENSTTYEYEDVYEMAVEIQKLRNYSKNKNAIWKISQEELERINKEFKEKGVSASIYTFGEFVDELIENRAALLEARGKLEQGEIKFEALDTCNDILQAAYDASLEREKIYQVLLRTNGIESNLIKMSLDPNDPRLAPKVGAE